MIKALRSLGLAATSLLAIGVCSATAELKPVVPDLNSIAKMRFHDGKIGNKGAEFFPNLPDIPGAVSDWYLTQWRKPEQLDPSKMVRGDQAAVDPVLGTPLYSFATSVSRFDIYGRGSNGFGFGLLSSDGVLSEVGGTDIFLSAKALPAATFDHELNYELDMTMPVAKVTATNDTAIKFGSVGVQIVTGFTVIFTDPSTKKNTNFFMQLIHADARNNVARYKACYWHGPNLEIVMSTNLKDEPKLQFVPFTSPPQKLRYRLNDHLCELLKSPFNCPSDAGDTKPLQLPPTASDFNNWRITSMYLGIETQNVDLRKSSKITTPQGTATGEIRISNLSVMSDSDRPFSRASCNIQ